MGIGLIAGLLLGLLAAALSQRGHPGLADLVRSLLASAVVVGSFENRK